MRLIKSGVLFILLLVSTFSFAQNESNIWHFGINAGLNFNVSPPAVISGGQITTREGVATISDKITGQLLFYTEGTTVWNRNHIVMPNGNGLLGDFSSTQSSIAVPKPGNANRYYLFTTALLRGMYYSEVDMTLAGGNGDVVAATKNTSLIAGAESSEKLIAVRHCNGVDYWVVTHKLFSSSFIVYLVNAAGVQPGVTYNIGATLADATNWTGTGYLKFSSTGGKLVNAIGPAASGQLSNVELLNFDNKTGAITGPVIQLTNFNSPYGVEFSPSGRYLYVSEILGKLVAQYDLAAANVNASRVVIQTSPNLNYGALQLGPDGKIYVSAENGYTIGYNFLSRIDNPEGAGAACNFVSNAVNLGAGRSLIGLPTFAANYLLKDSSYISYTSACTSTNGVFSFTTTANVDSVKWNFGDGSPVSTQLSPTHTYTNANTYNVQLIVYKSCNKNDTVRKPVAVTDCMSNCNNWLRTPSFPSYANIGNLSVSGNQITVEATYVATLDNGGFGNLVSKHSTASDANYLLRPYCAEITTTNGYFLALAPCAIVPNKTYHVALVYDGTTLKFYRNGFLLKSVPASGNLVTNSWQTWIGHFNAQTANENFIGYINEVRIWNVARTQSQLQTYMNSSLPSPTTQTGLLGYYTFDNLLNKQGNTAYNATLGGAATINATNPVCNFTADSCRVNTPIGNIINAYTPVLAFEPCANKLTVQDGSAYNVGDTVLLIQMKGAVIDSTNTAAFGTITDYKSAGNYEFNYVKGKTGNVIELKNKLTRTYEIPDGKVQLIRVPYYDNVTITNTLTCLPWDGSKGGVLVFNVKDTITLNEDIDVNGKGFLKGTMRNSNVNTFTCGISNYYYPNNTQNAAGKGEGIASLSANRNSGKGPAANGGGGGMNTNSGGGGGANGNIGGRGGNEYNSCPNYLTSQTWGLPGMLMLYNNANNKIFLGGGGGAGHCNNQFDNPAVNADFNGGNGGGIVLISANYLKNNNKKITAKGDKAYELNITNSYVTHDGMGGGGAGGTVLLNINNYINNTAVDVAGGNGGNMVSMPTGGLVGPGGGGGGGTVWVKQNAISGMLSVTNNGGSGGVIVQDGNNPYGATGGLSGITLGNLIVPVDTEPFRANIDSVRIKDTLMSCKLIRFEGLGYTNTSPIAQWQWTFGDGGTGTGQWVLHNYANAGTYTIKLVVTDVNGCKDSTTKLVTVADCAIALCKSSFGLSPVRTAIVDIVPSGSGAFNQLYSAATGFTWEAWYRPAGNIINRSLLISTEDAVLFQDIFLGFGWGATPNALSFMISDDGFANATVAVESMQNFNPNTWYHVAAVCDYDNAQLRLYLDGTLVATATIPAGILAHRLSGNRITQIGNASARASAVNGSMDEIRFWSRPISVTEIQTNMNQCITLPQTGLVAYFKADETNGNSSKSAVDVNFSAALRGVNWTDQVPAVNCVRMAIADSVAQFGCNTYFFKGLIQGIDPADITQWKWTFGDGGTANTQNASHTYTSSGSYTVKLLATDVNGCQDSITSNVTVNLLTIDAGRDTAFCSNSSVTVNLQATGTGGSTYSWTPTALLSNSSIDNPVATVSATTKFYVTVSNGGSCSAIDSVTVTVNSVPLVKTNNDTAICRLSPLPLNTIGAASYEWTPGSFVSNPAIANPDFIGTQTQELVVTGTSAAGCKATDTVMVTVNPLPTVKTIPDTTICGAQALVLTTTGASNYQWNPPVLLSNPNSANPTYTGTNNQTYEVVGTDANGCKGKDTVAITVHSLAGLQAPRDTSICRGKTATLNGNNGPAYQYVWSPATGLSNPSIDQPVFSGTVTTPYTVTITEDVCHTNQSFSVLVTVNSLPIVTATRSNDIDCAIPFSNLLATGAVQYVWSPAAGLDNPQTSTPRATPSNTTLYTVNGTDANGCSATAAVEVKVLTNGKAFSEMPNSFTPNGDGLNDCYGPGRFWQNIISMQFMIYNRWGEQVFYSTNPGNCWNGTYKGVKAEAGAYVYWLKVKTGCGNIEKKGTVLLIQ